MVYFIKFYGKSRPKTILEIEKPIKNMQIQETLTKFNWVDIVIICMVLTTVYKGSRKGFIIEVFKLLGLLAAIYVSLHYFSIASDRLLGILPGLGVIFTDFTCFLSLSLAGYLAITAIRSIFCRLIKMEAVSGLDKWGGFALGFLRGILLTSMLIILFHLSTITYLKASARKSYLGSRLSLINVQIYEGIFNGLVSRFATTETINKNINEIFEE